MRKKILVFLVTMMMTAQSYGDSNIKEPNVSGQFYPSAPQTLSAMLDQFFNAATVNPSAQEIKILISPHAGYVYSGAVAAHSFKAASLGEYSTIVLIGPSHFFDFPGISVWQKGFFKTPLGEVPIDEQFADQLVSSHEQFSFRPDVYEKEHSLEVELPFLQKTFKDFKIVPVLMGRPDYQVCVALAKSLKKLIADRDDVLIVISTDMSHYHPQDIAHRMDQKTLELMKDVDPQRLWDQCLLRENELCGFTSVITALIYANEQNLKDVDVLKYAHSGDVSGDHDRVVGYCSVVFKKIAFGDDLEAIFSPSKEDVSSLTPQQKKRLIQIAKDTITHYLNTGKVMEVSESDPRLSKEEGAFVTIHKNEQLRGCIGQIIGQQPLYLTVRDMAISSATQDPRFPPVKKEELNSLSVEISVLSVPQIIKDVNQIQMGIHGVIVSQGPYKRGVFLPQVATETGWSKEEFLSQLCSQKAGLPPNCWRDPQTILEMFTAQVFSEESLFE